ncbi:ABC transporter substrate-binding protein [Isachenkonia alkalipeptolytica]|uniref:ABC transporter substrate-binding protein n=1 Tax=Isachenkonia alkalipeptolytica TaxID=2565777 RepID=A0AA43XJY2_9CLOT|nr:ABC transporter substrate-binding protein [Isachenkonia alkalipeptolytica]NBG88218.1 ABC transporter substrate-binding protein [Isachenkonia alkalipeptolytica]
MRKLGLAVLILMLMFSLIACGQEEEPEESEDPGEAVENEEETAEGDGEEEAVEEKPFEGTVLEVSVAYGGAEDSFEQFTEETGIEIEWVSLSTGAKLSQLQAEEGETTTDIWFGGGVDSYFNARDLGYLHQYESPEFENIDPKYLDPEGYFGALSLVPFGFIVNEDLIEDLELDMPSNWEDLRDSQYSGEIIMADPSISGGQYAILSSLIQVMGEDEAWDYWEAVNENVDFYAQSGGEPQQKVAAGEFAIGLTAIHGQTFGLMETAPVAALFPEEHIPWIPAPIAIFENSENKEAAKVFVDWYLSEHGQTILMEADARIMANENVAPPEEMDTLNMEQLIDFDLEEMGRERENILDRWKDVIGE